MEVVVVVMYKYNYVFYYFFLDRVIGLFLCLIVFFCRNLNFLYDWLIIVSKSFFVVAEIFFSNGWSSMFCYGIREWWRIIFSSVKRKSIHWRQDAILWGRNNFCFRLSTRRGHNLQRLEGMWLYVPKLCLIMSIYCFRYVL